MQQQPLQNPVEKISIPSMQEHFRTRFLAPPTSKTIQPQKPAQTPQPAQRTPSTSPLSTSYTGCTNESVVKYREPVSQILPLISR